MGILKWWPAEPVEVSAGVDPPRAGQLRPLIPVRRQEPISCESCRESGPPVQEAHLEESACRQPA